MTWSAHAAVGAFRIDIIAPHRATGHMPVAFPFRRKSFVLLWWIGAAMPLGAQLVAFDGFGEYAAGVQVESGSDGTNAPGLDGGAGWGGAYDINTTIKSKVRIEDRSTSPVNYVNGGIEIYGGDRALRFYEAANGTYALYRPLGTAFNAAEGGTLWFSVLFRTAAGGATPLENRDLFQIGFDDNDDALSGNPRVSIGSNSSQTTFPSPARFFARSTTTVANTDFYDGLDIAPATTYLLVGRIQPHHGEYDTVSLFVNPSDPDHPGDPSAEIVLPSGLSSLSHAFIRTNNLDSGDAYVLDEWHIGRDYGSVVLSLPGSLRMLHAAAPEAPLILRWPASPAGTVLETSTTLAPDSWTEASGAYFQNGAEWEFPVPIEPGTPRRFFRLRR